MTNTCAHCGVEYEAKSLRSRYCRASCRALASKARRRALGLVALPPPRRIGPRPPARPRVEHRCDQCGTSFWARAGTRFCSTPCRQAWTNDHRAKRGVCSICGDPMQLGQWSSKVSNAHRSCRASIPLPPCPDCGGRKSTSAVRCWPCAQAARRFRPDDDPRSTRRARERSAPGLTTRQIDKLRRAWRAQGRGCIYCGAPATTVDHVVPLVRGGTNFEGNLAPACKECNSRKAFRLVIELRAKGVRRDQGVRPLRQGVRVGVGPREVLRVDLPGA